MSTKNLARTAIEGGRHNVYERRESTSDERSANRNYLRRLTIDPGSYDEAPCPKRLPVGVAFSDKTQPARRWLLSRVGKPWSEVYSELRRKFDTRTTAGRHILFDHMLRDVGPEHDEQFRYWQSDFYIDSNDILRVRKDGYAYRHVHGPQNPPQEKAKFTYRSRYGILSWLRGRKVVEHDGHLCWNEPTQFVFVRCNDMPWCRRPHEKTEVREVSNWPASETERIMNGYVGQTRKIEIRYHKVGRNWHLRRKLNARELQYWKTLDPVIKNHIFGGTFE